MEKDALFVVVCIGGIVATRHTANYTVCLGLRGGWGGAGRGDPWEIQINEGSTVSSNIIRIPLIILPSISKHFRSYLAYL